jgi:hypothetical protein
MEQLLSPSVSPVLCTQGTEPSEALAWEYVNGMCMEYYYRESLVKVKFAAFYDNCWEARLGFVSRSDFEAQLQTHFYNELPSRNDPAAYALRNVVFAAGHRSLQMQSGTVSYSIAQESAWQGCFSNALSVLAGLLLSPPRPPVVQALALMASKFYHERP